jgi:predicted mannosyl-3-phosphoglycerate phosphatase (HAD superfamily)
MIRAVVLSDIDHTMLGRGGDATGVPETVETLETLGVPIVPVTAKSITEVVATAPLLGLWRAQPPLAIVESGAAVYAVPGILPYIDGERIVKGLRLEYKLLYDPSITLELLDREARKTFREVGCNPFPRDVETMSPEELSLISGLPVELAGLIPTRDHMKVYFSRDMTCKVRAKKLLESRGFYAGLGRNFIHVGAHRGKAHATTWLLNNIPRLLHKLSIAFGDSQPDKEMLEKADIPVVIPPEEGPPLRLSRDDYQIADQPAPRGWARKARELLLRLL